MASYAYWLLPLCLLPPSGPRIESTDGEINIFCSQRPLSGEKSMGFHQLINLTERGDNLTGMWHSTYFVHNLCLFHVFLSERGNFSPKYFIFSRKRRMHIKLPGKQVVLSLIQWNTFIAITLITKWRLLRSIWESLANILYFSYSEVAYNEIMLITKLFWSH